MELIITAELNEQDWQALQQAAQKRMAPTSTVRRLQPWLIYFLGTLVVFGVCDVLDWRFSLASFIGGLLVALLSFLSMREQALRSMMPNKQGLFLGNCTYVLNERGLVSRRTHASSECDWASVMAVTHSPTHVFIWLDTAAGFCIPARYLPMRVDDLITQIDLWRAPTLPLLDAFHDKRTHAEAMSDESNTSITHTVWRWLTWRSAGLPVQTSSAPAWLLGFITLLMWMCIDYIQTGPGALFSVDSVPMAALYALALLSLSALLARSTQPTRPLSQALLVLLGVLPILLLLAWATSLITATHGLSHWLWVAYALIGIYALGYLARAVRGVTGQAPWIPITSILVLGGLFTMLALDQDWRLSFWNAPEADTANSADLATWQRGDELLFDQAAKVDAALTQVQSAAGAQPQAFFLGFAGVAEQKVFAEEIKLAAQVVARRFHTAQHQLLLINDRRDVNTQPLAMLPTLRHALKGMAKKMRLDQDVLILALSSHGDETPELQVSNGYLPMNNLNGSELKAALDDAGIKWRVLVISACHAGAFIPYLKDTHTIVITAAAASKTSFGCADDRDLTYFGEAFYRDAFPKAADLQTAFATAKTAIAQRERAEKVDASDPQAYFGIDMLNHLRNL